MWFEEEQLGGVRGEEVEREELSDEEEPKWAKGGGGDEEAVGEELNKGVSSRELSN